MSGRLSDHMYEGDVFYGTQEGWPEHDEPTVWEGMSPSHLPWLRGPNAEIVLISRGDKAALTETVKRQWTENRELRAQLANVKQTAADEVRAHQRTKDELNRLSKPAEVPAYLGAGGVGYSAWLPQPEPSPFFEFKWLKSDSQRIADLEAESTQLEKQAKFDRERIASLEKIARILHKRVEDGINDFVDAVDHRIEQVRLRAVEGEVRMYGGTNSRIVNDGGLELKASDIVKAAL